MYRGRQVLQSMSIVGLGLDITAISMGVYIPGSCCRAVWKMKRESWNECSDSQPTAPCPLATIRCRDALRNIFSEQVPRGTSV